MPPRPMEIAIIGLGALFPKAQTPSAFWDNVLAGADAIVEIPRERWDWRLYFDPDPGARDKIYARRGGFLDDVPFDPLRYGIPPVYLKSIEPQQLLVLEAVRLALEDAGCGDGSFDRENTSVILGSPLSQGDVGMGYMVRSELPRIVGAPQPAALDRLPEWTEASFAGYLLNVTAGRVANRFDLGGTNQTIDAACASSLAAIKAAADELECGRCNLAIAGGVDATQNAFSYLSFSKTRALSPGGRACAFDKKADGTVLSEGIGIVVLKRLADARRDSDRIYAVLRGIGSSSDGKALSLYAPNPAGQIRAFRRAYEQAGFPPATVGLIEAHGTGTAAGDQAELETVIQALEAGRAQPKSCAIGSVKNQIGHTKGAAGAASLIKAVLALYHKALPPHINVTEPLDVIAREDSPLYLVTQAAPWIAPGSHPRRAGVSSFGFGGTNFHAVLEEDAEPRHPGPAGAGVWPSELFVFRAAAAPDLARDLGAVLDALRSGAASRLKDLAAACAARAQGRAGAPVCFTAVVRDLKQLAAAIEEALPRINGRQDRPLRPHLRFETEAPAAGARIAFLVPGLGSQYPGMAREAALYFPEVRRAVGAADRILRGRFAQPLSRIIFPPDALTADQEHRNRAPFEDTHVTVSALYAVQCGFADLAGRLGLAPDMVIGHSFGEPMALHIAGGMEREEFLRLGEERSRIMAEFAGRHPGGMLAANLPREETEKRLAGAEGVVVGNVNAPRQTVVSGPRSEVFRLRDRLKAENIPVHLIPGDCAFHSPLFEPLARPLTELFARASVRVPEGALLFANNTGDRFPSDAEMIRERLARHLLDPVEFMRGLDAMYAAGARVFVELGPKSVLTNLVNENLKDRGCTAVSLDGEGGGLQGLLKGLALLAAKGLSFDLSALFAGRNVEPVDFDRLAETTRPPPLSKTVWLVNGGSARPKDQKAGHTGKLPPLDSGG